MPSPTLRLRPGGPEDVEDMCETLLDAFSGNMVGRTFFPRTSASARRFWLDALADEIRDPNARFVVVEDAVTSPPTLVAFAKWNAPAPPATLQPPLPDSWPEDRDPALADVFFQTLADKHHEIMADRPHWYLEMIVTKGRYQGQGAGGMLLGWGVDKADDEGVECYLDATPQGKHLYERFGFKDEETWSFFDETYRHSFMIRVATRNPLKGGTTRF
ncbi:hypothetical protein J7T55_001394 [Diaporthe amygdali]|uniref:uncharacterized protein n=1 Tax=Phomopsis amygdali TaxID=1214568 RepID=UPI0022FE1934|nr:uncharacterized protein J7T55_001394 [Diaporthe amygdali]KAJ0114987.1 hypothetical protein J7T55_001394 [Diaporthe amygdali]